MGSYTHEGSVPEDDPRYKEVLAINPQFIENTGLNSSLTPSRANGFLNIFLKMNAQAKLFL